MIGLHQFTTFGGGSLFVGELHPRTLTRVDGWKTILSS